MADGRTTNYNLVLPEIGASKDNWGSKINQNFSTLDTILKDSLVDPGAPISITAGGYIFMAGQNDYPASIRAASDQSIVFAFRPSDAINGVVSSTNSVMTAKMADARYAAIGSTGGGGTTPPPNYDGVYFKINAHHAEASLTAIKSGVGGVRLNVGGIAVASGGAKYLQGSSVGQGNLAYHFVAMEVDGTHQFRVLQSGSVQNRLNSYGSTSDARLKSNINPASPQLNDVLQLNVVNFEFNDGVKQIGLIAQEVALVKPGLVEADHDGYYSVKYSVLVPILIKALQELNQKVEDLSARLPAAS